jgi:hypothetical protein
VYSQSQEIVDEFKITVGDMVLEVYQSPPFILAEILNEFIVEATIQKSRKQFVPRQRVKNLIDIENLHSHGWHA